MKLFCFLSLCLLGIGCTDHSYTTIPGVVTFEKPGEEVRKYNPAEETAVDKIPLPTGYERIKVKEGSFAAWVRKIPLRKDNTVRLWDGTPTGHQGNHYAVIDISTGNRDLQQCADALMRLRAEYYFSLTSFSKINFLTGAGAPLSFDKYARGERYTTSSHSLNTYASGQASCYSHDCLMQYLTTVFSYCGTYSLKLMTNKKLSSDAIVPGDILLRPGSPGHSMMVADVAINKKTGERLFLLLQGFMPAQDIHIVNNLDVTAISPWYKVDTTTWISTPSYIFSFADLREWKE